MVRGFFMQYILSLAPNGAGLFYALIPAPAALHIRGDSNMLISGILERLNVSG